MTDIACFLLQPTNRVRRWLRRYRSSALDKCHGPMGYHDALVQIDDGQAIPTAHGGITTDPLEWPQDDPRWPKVCSCGYQFVDQDEWQLFYGQLYSTPDGKEVTLRDAPPGAMWYADWLLPHDAGPDSHSLAVMTPGGVWDIDSLSDDGNRWTRTGVVPKITVRPSIRISNRYHGLLTDGVLADC